MSVDLVADAADFIQQVDHGLKLNSEIDHRLKPNSAITSSTPSTQCTVGMLTPDSVKERIPFLRSVTRSIEKRHQFCVMGMVRF